MNYLASAEQVAQAQHILKAVHREDIRVRYDPEEGDFGALVVGEMMFIEPRTTEVPSIIGRTPVNCWGVYTVVMSGGTYWDPPDADVVDVVESVRAFDEAVLVCIEQIMRAEIDNSLVYCETPIKEDAWAQ